MDESIDLPCTATQVATARRFVGGLLAHTPRRDDAELLVSELAGNAVRYSASRHGGHFTVRVESKAGWAHIEVSSLASEPWEMAPAGATDDAAESGRGLGIVYFLADRMGHSFDGTHDTVWADLEWEPSAESEG